MKTSFPVDNLPCLLKRQLSNFFPVSQDEYDQLCEDITCALSKVQYNFSHCTNKYYNRDGEVYFSPWHSGQYTIFLYYLSHIAGTKNNDLGDKIYYLNKIMNSCDLYYQIELPDIFFCDHPVGTVLGRAEYENGFTFSQNCTIGNNHGIYPVIGRNVRMCAGTSIIGKCRIGDNVILGAGALIKDEDVPDNSLVFGQSPNLLIKKNRLLNTADAGGVVTPDLLVKDKK